MKKSRAKPQELQIQVSGDTCSHSYKLLFCNVIYYNEMFYKFKVGMSESLKEET